MTEYMLGPAHAGTRIDLCLAEVAGVTRSEAQRLLDAGVALVNGRPAKPSSRAAAADRLTVDIAPPRPLAMEPQPIALTVAYEDDDIVVIDKPRGMVVHPAPGHSDGTLVNALLAHVDGIGAVGECVRPGVVHRLDKDTSGLLVVAKNDAAHLGLQQQIAAHTARREYLAVLWGDPRFEVACIDAPIGRHPVDRKRMCVLTDPRLRSRSATTEIRVVERWGCCCLARASLGTGRTHQIRVHCQYIGHPVVGDPAYGGARRFPSSLVGLPRRAMLDDLVAALGGQALHAGWLSFDHPRTGERLELSSPPPAVLADLIEAVRAIVRDAGTPAPTP